MTRMAGAANGEWFAEQGHQHETLPDLQAGVFQPTRAGHTAHAMVVQGWSGMELNGTESRNNDPLAPKGMVTCLVV